MPIPIRLLIPNESSSLDQPKPITLHKVEHILQDIYSFIINK